MFRKALQIVATLATLIGAHLAYTRGFEVILERLEMAPDGHDQPFVYQSPTSALKAAELAREMLPPGHWTSSPDLPINYYDAERGFYMYAQGYKSLKGGKQLELRPFALISASKDGKSHKVITADLAIVDLSQKFLSMKATAAPMKILHAEMSGNVVIRDDKGTADGSDDMIVGPLTHIEYDEKSAQITSDSHVVVRDRNLTAEGDGLLIQLRRRAAAVAAAGPGGAGTGGGGGGMAGFEAESVYLRRDVHIVVQNVGSTNILPGKSRPDKAGQVPMDLRCDGEMEILLPPGRPPVAVGPPAPALPTYAKFQVNVRVIRGTHAPDQLNCDSLLLTLMPTPKDPAKLDANGVAKTNPTAIAGTSPTDEFASPARANPAGELASGDAPPPSSGPLTELKIREALAQGHAVWVQSESQNLKARCIELKYKKFTDGRPDETYLNGGVNKRLYVEKIEVATTGPDVGSVRKVLRLYAVDATIFDDGQGGASTIVARGPGKAEERPALNASVERTAWWEDQLILRTEAGPVAPGAPLLAADGKPAKGPLRRELTLTGVSKLVDHVRENTLDARSKIIARFRETPKTRPDGPSGTEIESMHAYKDVNLTAPNKTLVARDMLVAVFEDPALDTANVTETAARSATTTRMTTPPASPAPVPGPAIPVAAVAGLAAGPGVRTKPTGGTAPTATPGEGPKVAQGGEGAELGANPDPAKPTPPAVVEPAVDARANRVWAKIRHRDGVKDEFRDAQLRGNVMVHQDPAPGKTRGTDASGEALDLVSQGDGLMKFRVVAAEPEASAARARLVGGGPLIPATPPTLARVETEEMTIEGPDIGLDKKSDYAEVNGGGKLTEWTDRGLLDDKGLNPVKVRTVSSTTNNGVPVVSSLVVNGPPKARLTITWNDQMRFHGKTVDPQGRPAAKAEFRGTTADVRTPDGRLISSHGVEARMENAYIGCDSMDVFTDKPVKLNKDARRKDKDKEAEPKDDDAPAEPAAQIALMDCRGRDRMVGDMPMPGVDVISQKFEPGSRDLKEKQRIYSEHVVYDKRTGDFTAPGEGLVFLYRRKAAKKEATAVTVSGTGKPASKLPPMELTKVNYSNGMQGRFGVGKDKADSEDRVAEFYGDVQGMNAIVKDGDTDLDFDKGRPDAMFLTAQYLRVVSAPLGDGKNAQQTLYAKGNAQACTVDKTIQGDRITYDSTNEVAYVYGDDGREVVLIDQRTNGQPATPLRGKSARYNRATREAQIVDPSSIYFADLKSGTRIKPAPPNLGGSGKKPDPTKQQRVNLYKTPRNHIERNGSTGR